MKRKLFFLLFSIWVCYSFGQINVKTYGESIENGYEFYADNFENCPVSIRVTFKLKNLKSSKGNGTIFLLPANSKKNKLSVLTTIKKGKYGYSSQTSFNYGDHNLETYNEDYEYDLPYKNKTTFAVSQGYNGKLSHQNQKALDFTMPIGTEICAAREGVVIKVIDINNKTCPSKECEKFNNLIIIYHEDGTFAEYVHIKRKGAIVKEGDIVKKGQVIAQSGNIGWSTGPHLHFVTYIQTLDGRKTLPTKFRIEDGKESVLLVEKEAYSKNY